MKKMFLTVGMLMSVSLICADQDAVIEQEAVVPVVEQELASTASEVPVASVVAQQAVATEVSVAAQEATEAPVQEMVATAEQTAVDAVSQTTEPETSHDVIEAGATDQATIAATTGIIARFVKNPLAQKISTALAAAVAVEEASRRMWGMGVPKAAALGASVAALVVAFPELRDVVNSLIKKPVQQ